MASATLARLIEEREKAAKALEDFASPIIADKREMTEEEEAQRKDLRKTLKKIDTRMSEVEEDEKRDAEFVSARSRHLGDSAQDTPSDTKTIPVGDGVKSEARTYGEDSPNSYYLDLCRSALPGSPGAAGAVERLNRHAVEVAGEIRDPRSEEGKRARRVVAEWSRRDGGNRAETQERIDRAATFVLSESRSGMDTTASSGGSFVTPQYFVSQYAPYRQFGRQFADAAHKMPLPDYGVTIFLPAVTNAAGVASQALNNEGITETDPNASYKSVNLTTNAGQVTVSQQLLDRAGPNFAYDQMVFDQLTRAYNLTLDVYIATQALANANSVTTSATTGWQALSQKIAGAKSNIEDTAGTVMPATHIWFQPSTWNFMQAQIDASGGSNRPGAVPTYAGPYNAWAAGDPTNAAEGDTGFRYFGLPVFTDANIPSDASSHNQIVVANQDEIWYWEGSLVNRAVPQTFAQNLSVLLQVYAYVGAIVRYPNAVQSVSGSALNVTF